MKLSRFALFTLLLSSSIASAQQAEPFDAARLPSKPLRLEQPETDLNTKKSHHTEPGVVDDFTRRKFHVGLTAQTVFPTFLGGGLEVSYKTKFALGVQAGLVPRAYSNAIAEAAAAFSGETSYRDVVKAAFEKNSLFRLYTEYRFGSQPRRGFRLGAAYSLLDSSGSAPIDTALEASTGRDFTLLKQLLGLQGRDANVHMDANLGLGELYLGYGWRTWRNLFLGLDLGVAKVFTSKIHLKTDAPAYDNSANGRTQLRASESDLESILKKYGITPTVSLRAGYFF